MRKFSHEIQCGTDDLNPRPLKGGGEMSIQCNFPPNHTFSVPFQPLAPITLVTFILRDESLVK
jgi:hypothetical protein